jgi:hypothetical protein
MAPDSPDMRIARRAAQQWGVLSLRDLHACGVSTRAVGERVRRGRLHAIHRGVYAVGHPHLPLHGRFLAATQACGPRGVLSHFSAAALWEIVPWEDRHPEVTVASAGTRVRPGLRVHRSSMLAVPDITRHLGIPVTSPARTLVDLAAVLDERRLRRAVRQAEALCRVNVRQVADALGRAGHRHGSAKLAAIIATGPAATRSALEDVVLDLILGAGIDRPDVNVPLVLGERRVIPDFRWPRQRLVLEADGAAWHDGAVAREDDVERQALLERYGERVVRVTWQQATGAPDETVARLLAAGAPRGAPAAAPRGAPAGAPAAAPRGALAGAPAAAPRGPAAAPRGPAAAPRGPAAAPHGAPAAPRPP